MPKFTLLLSFLVISISLSSQPTVLDKKYDKDSAVSLYRNLFREVPLSHPGFYTYHSPQAMNAYIDSILHTFAGDSVTGWEIYRKMKPVVGKIGCLHTGLAISDAQKKLMDSMPNLLPFQLFIRDHKAWITKNVSEDKSIEPGTEITRINGRSIEELLAIILPAIPSDGYNMTMKYLALYHDFPGWYRSMVGLSPQFTIGIIRNGKMEERRVPAVSNNNVASPGFLKEIEYSRQLEFEIINQTGFLAIHSFAKTDIKASDQRFKKFMKRTFRELKEKKVPNLVVDLRHNTGGTDANAARFASYFFDKPFNYWDRIEVTETVAKQIKGVYRLFFKKPVKKDSIYLWRKSWYTKEFNFYQRQQPAKNNFKGNVYVLINGFCMSASSEVASILSYNKKAVLIGEETGGAAQGNTSGMMPETKVMDGLILTVPLMKYVTAVDPAGNFGRGAMPHHAVTPTLEQIINGEDVVMQYALKLIRAASTTPQ
jgi:hypothetical protein